jgi:hypothetical protein
MNAVGDGLVRLSEIGLESHQVSPCEPGPAGYLDFKGNGVITLTGESLSQIRNRLSKFFQAFFLP